MAFVGQAGWAQAPIQFELIVHLKNATALGLAVTPVKRITGKNFKVYYAYQAPGGATTMPLISGGLVV